MELTEKQPTLCLNMIVKNESRIIRRLFDSVVNIVDCYCICDTGSTDNTIEIIEQYFREKNIPGKVVQEPFKNFCHNRTFALKECAGMSDFVLLLDADMILEVNNFNKLSLNAADSFTILQGNESFYYQNMRIVRNNGLYSYSGVTHEYINTPSNNRVNNFKKEEIFIRDIGDGGAKSDKFERDVRLLKQGIIDEPNNGRYYFYLGNSYHDAGKYQEAIPAYQKRIELGGWQEEVWYSYFRLGLCYKHLGNFGEALKYWLEGYDFYPERLEALYEIIKHYRFASKHKLCMMFYKTAKDILQKNANRDHYLFLHNNVYTHKIDVEYTIFAAYLGVKNIDNEIVTVLNHSDDGNEVSNLLSNMKFYKKVLEKTELLNVSSEVYHNINGDNTKFYSSSSCLIPNPSGNGYLMNIRYVNYHIDDAGCYHNCDKHIITINRFVEFDKEFKIEKEQWMNLPFDGRRYIGVEDVKIYYDQYKDKLLHIGTGYHANEQIGIVSGNYNILTKELEVTELKQHFKQTYCEKNWIFVDYKNESNIIYDWHPLTICKLEDNNEIKIIETKTMPKIFSRARGSTCGFVYNKKIGENHNGNIKIDIYDKEIWFVNHIVSYENPRHYYHIISVFDENMNLLRYSSPFKFEGEPIEYCLSILVEDDKVFMNYSTWDRTTKIGIYSKQYIDSILKYK